MRLRFTRPRLDDLPPVRLTARGWLLAGAAIVGVLVAYIAGWPALLAVSLFCGTAVAAGVVVTMLAPISIEVERRIAPDVTEPRRPVTVRLTIGGSVAAGSEWTDIVPVSLQLTGRASGRLPRLGAGLAATEAEYVVTPKRRGIATIGPLRLERTDALGVAVAMRRGGGSASLTVLPTVHELVPPGAATRADLDPDAVAVFGLTGDQRDIIAREYRAGDPMRQVDWRATAHRGELMVRSEAAAAALSTALVFDVREMIWNDPLVFEWAVECVASLVAAVDARGSTVRLATDLAGPIATDGDAALLALATVSTADTGVKPADLVRRVRGEHVQVLHVVTGARGAGDLEQLPPAGQGLVGLVSVVGAVSQQVRVPRGWRVTVLDPRRPVEEAWSRA